MFEKWTWIAALWCSCFFGSGCSDDFDERPTQPGLEDAGTDPRATDGKDDSNRGDSGQNDAGQSDASLSDAGQSDTGQDAPDASTCDRNEIPLTVVIYGDNKRFYADIEIDGESKLFQVDTGSGLTFEDLGAGGPDYVPVSSVGTIGCERVEIAGRGLGLNSPDVNGRPVVGIIGMDFLLERPSVLDIEQETIVGFREMPRELIERAGAFSVSFDRVLDHALVPLSIDGQDLRLLFDTGAAHTMHVGVEGKDGDEMYYVQDAQGTLIPVWRGQGELEFPGQAPIVIPVERAPEFPYFEGTIDALGGNLHGLLGVSAFEGRVLVFEGSQNRFWSVPRL